MTTRARIATFIAAILALWGGIWGLGRSTHPLGAIGGPTALCPLGWYQPDPNTSQCATAFGWQPAISGTLTSVFSVQGLAPNDDDFVVVMVKIQAPGAVDETGRAWFRYKWGFTYRSDGGAFADPASATVPTLVDSQIGSGLSSSTVTLTQSGSSLSVSVNCATAASCSASGSVDWFRNSPAPWVLSVSPAMAFASPSVPALLTLTTTPGATNGLTGTGCIVPGAYAGIAAFSACPSTSVPLQRCQQQSMTSATCFLPAGSYTAGVDSVCLLSAAGPFCLVNGFTLDAAAPLDAGPDAADAADAGGGDSGSAGFTLSGIYLQPAVPTGGTPNLVVTCAAGTSLCTSITSATMCGNAATVAGTATASITLTPPANTATNGTTCSITATSSTGGTFTLAGCTAGTSACGSGLGVLPANIVRAWYEPQSWNVGAQTWNDLVANEQMTKFGTAYTTTASWSGGQPGVTGSDTVSALFSSTFTQAQPFAVFMANSIASGVSANPFQWGGGNASSADGIAETSNLALFAGATQTASPAPTYATPFWHEDYINAATSFTAINGGAHTVVGATVGTNTISAGFVFFNKASASQGMIGTIGLGAIYNGTPTGTEETNMSNIALAIYGNSM